MLKILILHKNITRGRITKNAPLLYTNYSVIRVKNINFYNKTDFRASRGDLMWISWYFRASRGILADLVVFSRISWYFSGSRGNLADP